MPPGFKTNADRTKLTLPNGFEANGWTDQRVLVFIFKIECVQPDKEYVLRLETAIGAGYSFYTTRLIDVSQGVMGAFRTSVEEHERRRRMIFSKFYSDTLARLQDEAERQTFTSEDDAKDAKEMWEKWARDQLEKLDVEQREVYESEITPVGRLGERDEERKKQEKSVEPKP